jgi:hypothetical protein
MFMLWDQRAAARANFIESVYRSFETAFGTCALVDTLLEHYVSKQYRSANHYGQNG